MKTRITHQAQEELSTERDRNEEPAEPENKPIDVRDASRSLDCPDEELLSLYVEML